VSETKTLCKKEGCTKEAFCPECGQCREHCFYKGNDSPC